MPKGGEARARRNLGAREVRAGKGIGKSTHMPPRARRHSWHCTHYLWTHGLEWGQHTQHGRARSPHSTPRRLSYGCRYAEGLSVLEAAGSSERLEVQGHSPPPPRVTLGVSLDRPPAIGRGRGREEGRGNTYVGDGGASD